MFLIRKGVQEDYNQVLNIGDEQLGSNYLAGVFFPSSKKPIWVAVDVNSEQILGFLYVLLDQRKAIIKSIAVGEGFQRKGIGSKLICEVMKEISDKIDSIEVIAWEKSDQRIAPLQALLERLGFQLVDKVCRYWYEDSIRRGYECPSCGNPCLCNALIFSIPSSYFSENID